MSREEKDKIKEYQYTYIYIYHYIYIYIYQELVQYKKDALKNKWLFCFFYFSLFFLNIKMSEKRLKFNNIELNKKEFHKFKEPTDLLSVDVDQ